MCTSISVKSFPNLHKDKGRRVGGNAFRVSKLFTIRLYRKISTSLHDIAFLVWSVLKGWSFYCGYIPLAISPNYHRLELYSHNLYTSKHFAHLLYVKVALLMETFWSSQVKLSPWKKNLYDGRRRQPHLLTIYQIAANTPESHVPLRSQLVAYRAMTYTAWRLNSV